MKASLSWLSEYVSVKTDVENIAESLTMAGLEVETVTNRYDYLNSVMVGRVAQLRPHPNADKLRLAEVFLGDHTIAVVCGAPNIEENMHVACALPGTELWNGNLISKGTIRGEASAGMLCSAYELGLGSDDSGLMVLDSKTTPGQSIVAALNLNDQVIEIDLTPNRSDCLSLTGIAREVASFSQTEVTYPKVHIPPTGGAVDECIAIDIQDPELCPRYAAAVLTNIKIGPSPFWLQDKLISIGLRPINNVVDITNFVMMEMGQPLHAFDLEQVAQQRIVVRRAAEGELFTTLDEKERTLSSEMLMICDGDKPVAIAGVMGGLNSEISAETTNVLIESAHFNPISIRKTARVLGLHTDASHRFERGVDPEGTTRALCRAAQLMADICGGILVEGIVDAHPCPPKPLEIMLRVDDTNRLLGTDLTLSEIESHLRSIEFKIAQKDSATLIVTPPTYRVDVARPQDLMEEVARLAGYNNIPTTYPQIAARGKKPKRHLAIRGRIKNLLNGLGYSEVINYSFIHPVAYDHLNFEQTDKRRSAVAILNPLSEDQSVMRTTLVPGLLATMQRNMAKQMRNLRLFEIGKVFLRQGTDEQPQQFEMLTCLLTGSRTKAGWLTQESEVDFYDLKGVAEALLKRLGVEKVDYQAADPSLCNYTKYGHTAQITIADEYIGQIGELQPRVLGHFDLKQAAFLLEIDLSKLVNWIPEVKKASPIPVFPSTSRDMTIIVDRFLESKRIIDYLGELDEKTIETMSFFDVYEGQPIPEGKKSISLRIVYRSHQETLKDTYVNEIHKRLTNKVLGTFAADLPA